MPAESTAWSIDGGNRDAQGGICWSPKRRLLCLKC